MIRWFEPSPGQRDATALQIAESEPGPRPMAFFFCSDPLSTLKPGAPDPMPANALFRWLDFEACYQTPDEWWGPGQLQPALTFAGYGTGATNSFGPILDQAAMYWVEAEMNFTLATPPTGFCFGTTRLDGPTTTNMFGYVAIDSGNQGTMTISQLLQPMRTVGLPLSPLFPTIGSDITGSIVNEPLASAFQFDMTVIQVS